MVFIVMFNIILFLLLIFWTYKNMYNIEIKPKAIYIASSIIVIYILTLILYNVGGNPINKNLGEAAISFNRTIVSIFVGVNGIITMPYVGNILNKYRENTIDEKQFKKRMIIISIIFILCIIFEFNYMKDLQKSMLEIINQKR